MYQDEEKDFDFLDQGTDEGDTWGGAGIRSLLWLIKGLATKGSSSSSTDYDYSEME